MRGFRIGETHKHLFKLAAELLSLSESDVEDFILDDGKVRNHIFAKEIVNKILKVTVPHIQ